MTRKHILAAALALTAIAPAAFAQQSGLNGVSAALNVDFASAAVTISGANSNTEKGGGLSGSLELAFRNRVEDEEKKESSNP